MSLLCSCRPLQPLPCRWAVSLPVGGEPEGQRLVWPGRRKIPLGAACLKKTRGGHRALTLAARGCDQSPWLSRASGPILRTPLARTRSIERPVSPRTLARLPIALSGVSRVNGNDKARALEQRAARSGDLRELSYERGHMDRPYPLAESAGLTPDELGLLHSQVPGHHWNGWCRLTGDEGYYAACSCGWRSTDTADISPMLRQVKDHVDAVERSRGWRPSAPATGAGQGEIVQLRERARGLRATARGEQLSLSRSLSHSADLLSASAEQADRLVTELERGQSARTGAPTSSAEIMRHKADRARELRKAIVAAAAALAVITEEIAEIHLETSHEKAIDWIYGERLMQSAEATRG